MATKRTTMTVLFKEPGCKPVTREVSKDLKTMQELVGGYIQMVPMRAPYPNVNLVCDEEGKFKAGYKKNFVLPWGDPVLGSAFFVSSRGGSLTPAQIKKLETLLW